MLHLNINKKYQQFHLNCQVSFEPSIIGVWGPSGSGKTTLLNCISGIETPDNGSIIIDNHILFSSENNTNIPPEKRRIGYVFQEPLLFPHLNVIQNIKYAQNLAPINYEDEISYCISKFGIEHLLKNKVGTLSGGEQKRVAIIRAIATSPKLLLLDEPLNGIDTNSKNQILTYLKSIWTDLNIPIIYVSHNKDEILTMTQYTLPIIDGIGQELVASSQVINQPLLTSYTKNSQQILPVNSLQGEIKTNVNPDLTIISINNLQMAIPKLNASLKKQIRIFIPPNQILVTLSQPKQINTKNIYQGKIIKIDLSKNNATIFVDIGIKLQITVLKEFLEESKISINQLLYVIVPPSAIIVS